MRTKLLALSLALAATAFAGSPDRFGYVFKRGSRSVIRMTNSIDGYKRIASKYAGDFIWVNDGGRESVIRDAAVLAEASRAYAEVDAYEAQVHAAEERLRPLEKQFEAIERRLDDAGDRLDDESLSDSARRALEDKLHAAESEMRAIEDQHRAAEQAMDKVEDEMERREKRAEEQFDQIVLRAIAAGKAERQ